MIARLNRGGVYTQTDDICLLAVEKYPNMVSGLVQWALHAVETWCGEIGLSVNPDKTGLIVFTKKDKFSVSLNLFSLELFCTDLRRSSISK
jgi:hypothetical protein